MKTKIILFAFLIISFALISSGFIYSEGSYSDDKQRKTECPYLQGKSETSCPYLEGKIDKSNSECPYLNGEINCPYGNKDSKPEAESSNKGDSKEKKYYRSIKNIST
ncbi:MAG: hypothetical protein U5J96_01385 [Ignavibacteriaceae bacterium]|nr:hypothetical protein [Ignavibacteriaceae bacterium]